MKRLIRNKKLCKESKVIQTHRVFPYDLNHHKTLFGGKLMSFIDDTASISAARHGRGEIVTASMDKLDFLHPIYSNHSVCVETFVSGVGSQSMEVFAKVMGEDLDTGERYLAATSFLTFVRVAGYGEGEKLPLVIPQTAEEKMVCSGYEKRKAKRSEDKSFYTEFNQAVSLTTPWMDDE